MGLGRTILELEENILRLSRDNLQDCTDTHYLAPSMVIMGGARAIKHHKLCNLAERYFGSLRMELDKELRRGRCAVCLDKGKFVVGDVR